MEQLRQWIQDHIEPHLPGSEAYIQVTLQIAIIAVVAFIAHWLAKRFITLFVHRLVARTKTQWDDVLKRWNVLYRIAHLVPAVLIYKLAGDMFAEDTFGRSFLQSASLVYLIAAGMFVLDSFLNAVHELYQGQAAAREIPLRGFIQVIKVILYFLAFMCVVAILLGKDLFVLLGGLGAMTAVLMFIFKDAILGFIAGIQLTTNRMVAQGDWIEMPKYGADGAVTEILLTTVKVQNWDKTITSIPTYALISESFRNWRGMLESGGRRIMRSVYIDLQSIQFCNEEMLRRFEKIQVLEDYLSRKKKELEEYNQQHGIDPSSPVNGRKLTNVGTFRAYITAYLRNHPMINQEMTFLVRQLEPTPNGLPIQVYVFCKDKTWANFESIQSDIFDHIFAVAPEFGLRVFQNPSGVDIRQGFELLARRTETAEKKQGSGEPPTALT